MVGNKRARALGSLRGLALGDALGSQFFVPGNREALEQRRLPPSPWQWTDDAEMACSVFAVLARGRPPGEAIRGSDPRPS